MNLPDLVVPNELSDEAAAHIAELLLDLAVAFDTQYFAQICRYYDGFTQHPDIDHACHDGQLDLFKGDDAAS